MILVYIENMSAEQVALKIGCDPMTVRRFLKKHKETKKIENLPRPGRPPILKMEEKKAILKKVLKERCKPLCSIIKDLKLQCSQRTVARALHSFGVRSHVAAMKPFLTNNNINGRKIWCNQNLNRNPYEWWRIIFSDEMSVEVGKQSRQVRVWCYKDERYKHE